MRGEELTPWLIRYGYSQGAFPMTVEDGEVEWFQPTVRALFPIEGIHISRSMRMVLSRIGKTEDAMRITFDVAFEEVMRGCLRPDENWISDHFIRSYTQVYHEGWGHSVEVWQDGELVGGLYGIALGSCFCAESMFHRVTNASKVALWAMVEKCRLLGFTIFDAQVMNPHLKSLGAFPMPHEEYMAKLEIALRNRTPWSVS
ncbi:MAG TPA: leucyl/phenylalanyl-tRNA--protein transferase [Fimbriimonadaceae bacterium]|nr:leucyl/phenylalanyl-tRNA--protein transferase [Fimbriimonadaceae bacterium]